MNPQRWMKVCLYDSEPNGVASCADDSWTGIAYRIPRISLGQVDDLPYMGNPAAYILLGYDDNDRETAYIGKASKRKNNQSAIARISEPHDSIADWITAIVLTVRDEGFNASKVSLLENRIYNLAKEAERADVRNVQNPMDGNPEPDDLFFVDNYLEYARVALRVLGCSILDPFVADSPEEKSSKQRYSNSDNSAFLVVTDEGYVVTKGSRINPEETPTCPSNVKAKRSEFAAFITANNELDHDCLLTSYSASAAFVTGYSTNGIQYWGVSESES